MIEIREATPEDNDALIDLQGRCPQGSDLVMVMDRRPDYFARSKPFEEGHVYVATVAGDIVGVVEFGVRELLVGGVPCRSLYEFGMAVDPLYRRKGIATAIHGAVEEYALRNNVDLLHINIVEGNEASYGLFEKLGFSRFGEFKMNLMMVYEERGLDPGFEVRQAEVTDLEDIAAMVNDTHRGYEFFTPYTWESLMGYIERLPGFTLEDIVLAEDPRGIVACLGCWSYDGVLQFIIERMALRHKALSLFLRAAGAFAKMPRMPPVGSKVSQVFLTPVAFRDPEALKELIKHANNEALGRGVDYLCASADPDGPLASVYSGFRHTDAVGHLFVKPMRETAVPKRRGPLFVDMTDV